jgi:hypothetical protein
MGMEYLMPQESKIIKKEEAHFIFNHIETCKLIARSCFTDAYVLSLSLHVKIKLLLAFE